jgi:hypothetical protein
MTASGSEADIDRVATNVSFGPEPEVTARAANTPSTRSTLNAPSQGQARAWQGPRCPVTESELKPEIAQKPLPERSPFYGLGLQLAAPKQLQIAVTSLPLTRVFRTAGDA